MESIISNNSPKIEKIPNKDKNIPIENLDSLDILENKNKYSKENSKKNYISLKDLLADIKNEKITQTSRKISEENSNEKNDDSEINFSEKFEIEAKAGEVSESDINEFGEFCTSPKPEIKSPHHKNFFRKMTPENEQFNNLNNDKKKMTFSICDYYSGYDKYLSETENSTIDLSTSLNFVKKEKFEENFSEENENNNSNTNISEDCVNNNSNININKGCFNNFSQNNNNNINNNNNNNYNNNYNYGYNYNINNNNNININFNYGLGFSQITKNFGNFDQMKNPILFDSKYSKFDTCNDGYYTNYKLNYNQNYIVRKRRDWVCKNCGNYNYQFRDFCNRCNNPKL